MIKHEKLGGLKQRKCIVSHLWRLEVQSEGVSRAVLSLKALEESLSQARLASDVGW